jgi:tetratricopeptide (TPR) repeat protein
LGSKFFSKLILVAVTVALPWPGRIAAAESAEALFQRAASALSLQDYTAAEQGFLAVLRLKPRNAGALGNLGVVYSRTHRYLQAIDVYRRALRVAPADPELRANLGLVYIRQEQFAEALPIFEKLAADPGNQKARELYASCMVGVGKYEAARRVLEPLAASQPGNTGVLYMLGISLARLKQTDAAHAAWARMMEAASPAQAAMLMGKASYETENFEEAAGYFRKAMEAGTPSGDAHRELGKTLISLRDNDAAARELRLAGPEDSEALYFLGGVLAQENRSEAVVLLEKARSLNPDFWGSWYYLGKFLLDHGDVRAALADLASAAQLRPDESAVQYQLGRAYQKSGRAVEAKAAFERVRLLKARSLQHEVDTLRP